MADDLPHTDYLLPPRRRVDDPFFFALFVTGAPRAFLGARKEFH